MKPTLLPHHPGGKHTRSRTDGDGDSYPATDMAPTPRGSFYFPSSSRSQDLAAAHRLQCHPPSVPPSLSVIIVIMTHVHSYPLRFPVTRCRSLAGNDVDAG
ncbi:hypothetical protein ZWY2020_032262 [Hordeum vulgare]|nr:hypothetical protein ZWY2020_032262 [Hordeum vulgare]